MFTANTQAEVNEMTDLAKAINEQMEAGNDAEQILAMGIGDSVYQVEFIMEQIKIANIQ